ncbi:unnamed protein product, partial [marine sediment metagenome]
MRKPAQMAIAFAACAAIVMLTARSEGQTAAENTQPKAESRQTGTRISRASELIENS